MRFKTLLFLLFLSLIGSNAKLWKNLKKKIKGTSSRRAVEQPVHEPEEAPAAQEIGESSGAGPDETPAPQQKPTSPRAATCKDYVNNFVLPAPIDFLKKCKELPKPPLDPLRPWVFKLLTAHETYVQCVTQKNRDYLFDCLRRTLERGLQLAQIERNNWDLEAELAFILGTLTTLKSDWVVSDPIQEQAEPKVREIHEALSDKKGPGKDEKYASMANEILTNIYDHPEEA